jgi:hypothetical protein
VALGDRIAAPLGERREAFQVARKNWKSCLRDPPLAHLASSCVSLAHMSKPVGALVRTGDKLAAIRPRPENAHRRHLSR